MGLPTRASNEAMAAWIAAHWPNWPDEMGSPITTRVCVSRRCRHRTCSVAAAHSRSLGSAKRLAMRCRCAVLEITPDTAIGNTMVSGTKRTNQFRAIRPAGQRLPTRSDGSGSMVPAGKVSKAPPCRRWFAASRSSRDRLARRGSTKRSLLRMCGVSCRSSRSDAMIFRSGRSLQGNPDRHGVDHAGMVRHCEQRPAVAGHAADLQCECCR